MQPLELIREAALHDGRTQSTSMGATIKESGGDYTDHTSSLHDETKALSDPYHVLLKAGNVHERMVWHS